MIRAIVFLAACSGVSLAQTPAPNLWRDLSAKRAAIGAFHQEYSIQQQSTLDGLVRVSRTARVTIDWREGKWRTQTRSGWRAREASFDGKVLTRVDHAVGEFTVEAGLAQDLAPDPYCECGMDTTKMVITQISSCGEALRNHTCVWADLPTQVEEALPPGRVGRRLTTYAVSLLADQDTGIILEFRTNRSNLLTNTITTDTFSRLHYRTANLIVGGGVTSAGLAVNAIGLKRVKLFSAAPSDFVQKQFAGSIAPSWAGEDSAGNPFALDSMKGRNVLLFFWTPACSPCRDFVSELQKLTKKGRKDLEILAIAVGQERSVVEAFWEGRVPGYPIVLDLEHPLPADFQAPPIPGFLLIGADGKIAAAAEGTLALREIKSRAKKAGIKLD